MKIPDQDLPISNSLFFDYKDAIKKALIKELNYSLLFLIIFIVLLVFLIRGKGIVWDLFSALVGIGGGFVALWAILEVRGLFLDYFRKGLVKSPEVIEEFLVKTESEEGNYYVKLIGMEEEEISKDLFLELPNGTEVHIIRGVYSERIWGIELINEEPCGINEWVKVERWMDI